MLVCIAFGYLLAKIYTFLWIASYGEMNGKCGGITVPKAVDTSSQRRVDTALMFLTKGAYNASFKKAKKADVVALADEIISAANRSCQELRYQPQRQCGARGKSGEISHFYYFLDTINYKFHCPCCGLLVWHFNHIYGFLKMHVVHTSPVVLLKSA